MTKQCRDCGLTKPQSEFFRSKNGSQGLAAYCKPCHNLRGKKARGTDGRIKEQLPDGFRRCGRCKEVKTEQEFYENHNGNKTQCKKCCNYLTWRSSLLRNYGVTPETYAEMWHQQNGKCAICETDLSTTQPHLDHCHSTGNPRGILCRSCNVGLGFFRDNPQFCVSASCYLLKHISTIS